MIRIVFRAADRGSRRKEVTVSDIWGGNVDVVSWYHNNNEEGREGHGVDDTTRQRVATSVSQGFRRLLGRGEWTADISPAIGMPVTSSSYVGCDSWGSAAAMEIYGRVLHEGCSFTDMIEKRSKTCFTLLDMKAWLSSCIANQKISPWWQLRKRKRS